jgi:hypothetical protein
MKSVAVNVMASNEKGLTTIAVRPREPNAC